MEKNENIVGVFVFSQPRKKNPDHFCSFKTSFCMGNSPIGFNFSTNISKNCFTVLKHYFTISLIHRKETNPGIKNKQNGHNSTHHVLLYLR